MIEWHTGRAVVFRDDNTEDKDVYLIWEYLPISRLYRLSPCGDGVREYAYKSELQLLSKQIDSDHDVAVIDG